MLISLSLVFQGHTAGPIKWISPASHYRIYYQNSADDLLRDFHRLSSTQGVHKRLGLRGSIQLHWARQPCSLRALWIRDAFEELRFDCEGDLLPVVGGMFI